MVQPTGVIDLLAFPPVGSLNPVLDTDGPYAAGDWQLTQFSTTGAFILPAGSYQIHGTYGVIVQPVGAIPPTWGYSLGFDSGGAIGAEGWRYYNRFAQLVVQHQVLGGYYATVDSVEIHTLSQLIIWPFRLIGGDQLGLNVSPGITVDLYYLCLL